MNPANPPARAVTVIPARMGSTRFPGKVLADKTGKPLIWHVWEAARRATLTEETYVATDDDRVRLAVERFGGKVVMTSPDHPNGTCRLEEAARILGLHPATIVVNVQGDEPEIEPGAIDAAVRALRECSASVATLASPFLPGDDPANPNIVKVVLRPDGMAIYFSRSLIPFPRNTGPGTAGPLKHLGLYAYRAEFLRTYVSLQPTALEHAEALEQLRVLEHGFQIVVRVHRALTPGIDTPEQYEAFVRRYESANPERAKPGRM